MKKTMGKLKQALSIVLAVAMIVTCLPQTGMSVMAAEDQSAESFDEPDVSIEAAEDEKNDSNESASVGDEADEPEEADTEEEAEEKEEEITIPKYDVGEDGEEDPDPAPAADPFDESKVTISVSGNDTASVTNKALSKESGSESYSFEAKAKDGYEIAEITAAATVSGNDTPVKQTLSSGKIKADGTKYTVPLTNSEITGAGKECENLTKLEITVETKAIPLEITVEAEKDAKNYSVDSGAFTDDGKQYFRVKPDSGYMISPKANAVTAVRKDGKAAKVEAGENEGEYYVAVGDTYGDVEIVVTAAVVEAFTVTIKMEDADDVVKDIKYTTSTAAAPKPADWKDIDVSGNDAAVTLESGSNFKIKFTLDGNYKAEVKAETADNEKAVTPASGVYNVGMITADTNVTITATQIEFKIDDPVINVDGKNVTKWEINEIEDEIEDTLIDYSEIEKTLLKGDPLTFGLTVADAYYIKSVECKVGSTAKAMTYNSDEEYELDIAKAFPNLQDGDAITVVIKMEKLMKVTFNLNGVTVKDARNTDPEKWDGIGDEEILYVKKGSSLALTAEMDEGDDVQLREAWYQAGTKQTDIKSKVNGNKFSIPITADTIVTIKSTAKEHYTLEFENKDRETMTVSDVKLGGKDVSGNDLGDVEEGTVTSTNKITFKVAAKKGYKPVVTVEKKDDENSDTWVYVKTLTPTAAGVYELTSLTADSRITIDNAGLDKDACNVLKITSDSKLSNAYTAMLTVSGNEVKTRLPDDDNTYLVPLEAAEGVLTIDLNPGYENLVVKLNGVVKTPDVTGNDPENPGYKITFTETRTVQNITVSADEKEAENDTIVKFANTAPHMSYKVDTKDGKVMQVTDGKVSNTYKIKEGSRSIPFTVTAANAYYVPVVKVNNPYGNEIAPVSVDTKKRIYTYNIAAANIINDNTDEDNIIYIDENPSDVRRVFVSYDDKAVEVSADVAGAVKVKESDDEENYTVTDGDTINFKVSVKDNYKLVNIIAKNRTTGKETKVTKNTISIKADAWYDLTVNTEALTAINVYEVGSEDDEAKVSVPMNKNKSYSVQDGTDYTVEVYNGAVAADLRYAYFAYGTKSTATVENGTVTVTINREDAVGIKKAKQLTLTLKDANKKPYTVTLELLPLAGVKKVDGVKVVKKENILTQTVNTTKSYAITMDPATAAVTLGARVVEEDTGVDAEVKGKTLVITTDTDTVREKLATVELYDETAPEVNGKKQTLYSFYVTTELPKLPTPTVALQSADDTTLKLTLGAKNLALPDNGKVYYKVVVTPDAKATAKLTDEQQTKVKSVTEYFEIEAVDSKGSTSQTEEVKVINVDFGEGFANTFDVEVTLVQSKGAGSSETEDDEIIELTSSKSVTKKGLKTKEPAYATKITFKKGASAVYTNQSEVLAATAVFDKNATYTTLMKEGSGVGAPEDLSYTGDEALEISIKDGNQILVSATSKTAPGKHVIRVTADITNSNNMKLTTADYTVTVERAIEDIKLDAPIVYKAVGKAASFTVGITYNEGTTQPKAKKVNWTITNKEGKELSKEEARGVTVKNGKVTIPKDYILTKDEGKEKFDHVYVTATAADVTANRTDDPVKETAEVYIYNQEISIGETILVKYDNANKNWKVIARSGETVNAEDLKGARIEVLKKGTVDKESYTEDELNVDKDSAVIVPVGMTYKVNNKAIVLDDDRIEEVNGGGLKNVTITATIADGSNRKSELKNLTVNYHAPVEYGLAVKQLTPWKDENAHVLHQYDLRHDFNGALDTVFELQVMELLGEGWDDCGELSAASNYTLAVTGASILEKDVIKGTYKIIGSKDNITVKLTDKSKKTNNATTYTLHNKSVSTAKAPTLKALTKGDLIAGVHPGDQQIRYSLTGFTGDPKNTYVLITLDAKDSTNIKNQARYEAFARDCNEFLNNTSYTVERLQNRGLVFGTDSWTDIPAGTYKLTVNFGIMADDGGFEAITKPVTLTVKASAPKKASAKLNNKYTLSIHNAAAGAVLTLNNKNVALIDVTVVNDNVNGKENNFTKYFEITEEEDGSFVLRIKNDLSKADLDYIRDTKKAKNDLTGWVTYTYTDGIYVETLQAQIVIEKYAEPAYTMDSGDVVSGNDMTVDLIARANKNRIPVAYVHTDAPTLEVLDVIGQGRDTVRFAVTGDAKKQDVYIVPATSAYTDALEKLNKAIENAKGDDAKAAAEKAFADAVKACGVKVTVTVNVLTTITANDKYIEFDKKSLTAAFNRDNYWVDDTSGNDPEHTPDYKGRYNITIPFTKKIVESNAPDVKIEEIKVGNADKTEDYQDLLRADIEYGESVLHFDLLKEKLAELELYGKTLKVKISVSRPDPNGEEEGKAISESFTFTLTLPKEAAAAATPQAAIDTVSGNAAKLPVVELENWQVNNVRAINSNTAEAGTESSLRESLYFENVEEVEKIIEPFNEKRDSDIEFKLGHWVDISDEEWEQFVKDYIAIENVVTFPTITEEGSIKYTVSWENFATAADDEDHTGEMVIERKIAKLPLAPDDLEDDLKTAINKAEEDLELTEENRGEFSGMLAAKIREQLLKGEKADERKHLRVIVWETENGEIPAENEGEPAKVTYTVCLQDVKYSGEIRETSKFDLLKTYREQLEKAADYVESFVQATVEIMKDGMTKPDYLANDISSNDLINGVMDAESPVWETIMTESPFVVVKIAGKMVDGKITEDPDFTVTEATQEADGKVEGTFSVEVDTEAVKDAAAISIRVPFELTIPRIPTHDILAIVAKVKADARYANIKFTNGSEDECRSTEVTLRQIVAPCGDLYALEDKVKFVVRTGTWEITEAATTEQAGKVVFKFFIKYGYYEWGDAEFEFEIPKLEAETP